MAEIRQNLQDNTLTIYMDGRLDSNNVSAAQTEIEAIRTSEPHENFVLDLEKLEYISSAGLREVLRLRKAEPSLRVINVSIDVYDVFEMTGFTDMITIEKAYRRMVVDGCTVIGEGAKGTVYRYDPETIVKVYKNQDALPAIQHERAMARQAFVLGIPTAISYDVVKVGEHFGSVFELLNAKSYSQLLIEEPENFDKYAKMFADMLRQIHETTVPIKDMESIKPTIYKWIRNASKVLSPECVAHLTEMVDATPDLDHMIHGDYHTNNVMVQNGESLLIDMDTLAYGYPIFELANVHTTYVGFGLGDPTNVEKFIGISYEDALRFYDRFIRFYLGTEDEARIAEVNDKIELLSLTRVIHHTIKRNADTETGKHAIEVSKKRVEELSAKVSSLLF